MLSSAIHNISFISACQGYRPISFVFNEDTNATTWFLEKESVSENDRYCPDCHAFMHIYETSMVRLKDMPSNPETMQTLSVAVKRFRCPNCKKSTTESIDFKEPGAQITRRAANWIRQLLRLKMSISDVCRITGIHWNTVSRIHKEHMDKALAERAAYLEKHEYKPKRLAVDEFAMHKGHTYATCVMDLDEGDIIWVGKGRALKDFKLFFEEIDKEYLSEVEAVAMDMNAAYNILIKSNMPNAEIVYDRYHFQAMYGKSVLGAVRLDEARKHHNQAKNISLAMKETQDKQELAELKEQRKIAKANYSTLKKSRWDLLMNSNNLSEKRQEKLSMIFEKHSDVAICYALKEEMCRLFTLTDEDEAAAGWIAWFDAAKNSGIEHLEKFAIQKEKRLPGLIAHAKHQISTGRLEGYNNKIKVAKRIGFGYRNDEYFFTLIKYLSLPAVKTKSPRNP